MSVRESSGEPEMRVSSEMRVLSLKSIVGCVCRIRLLVCIRGLPGCEVTDIP